MASEKFQKKVGKVMHEYKAGDLKSGGSGKKVKDHKQAIAIALSEARKASGTDPYPMGMNNLNSKMGPQLPKLETMNIGPMRISPPVHENPKIHQPSQNLGAESKNYDPLERSYSGLRAAVRRRKI